MFNLVIVLRTLEFRRQILHILVGLILILLLKKGLLTPLLLLAGVLGGMILIYFTKQNYRIPVLHKFLLLFEREKHLQHFPGRGIFFYLLGALAVTTFFKTEIAIASLAILAFGDAVTNIIGQNFGHIRIAFKPKKSIEGTLAGIIAAFLGVYCFSALDPLALLLASIIGMLAEIPHLKIGKLPLDDNLIIPFSAGLTLHLIYSLMHL